MRVDGQLGPLDWAVAARPISGESVCGDDWVVADTGGGALLAVIDGLGHGRLAAASARRAAEVLANHPACPLEALLRRCHRALVDSRGAAITLAQLDYREPKLRWLGVGNVSASLLRETATGLGIVATAPLRGGIVGDRLPAPLAAVPVTVQPGDLLLVGSDGLRADFAEHAAPRASARRLVGDILARSVRQSDDALVLAARYRGEPR